VHTQAYISNKLIVQVSRKLITKKIDFAALSPPMEQASSAMEPTKKAGRFAPTAIRLRAIRRASPYPTPAAFCKKLGITQSRLANAEGGYPIGRQLQDLIVKHLPWISRSYLMDGDERTVSVFTLEKLAPLIEEESDPSRSRSPRSPSSKKPEQGAK
jgi:hypothetical protein